MLEQKIHIANNIVVGLCIIIGFLSFIRHFSFAKFYLKKSLFFVALSVLFQSVILVLKLSLVQYDPSEIRVYLLNIFVAVRNVLLMAVGFYYAARIGAPKLTQYDRFFRDKKQKSIDLRYVIFCIIVLVFITVAIYRNVPFETAFPMGLSEDKGRELSFLIVMLDAVPIALNEEGFVRLFLQNMFAFWMKDHSKTPAIVLSSLIWTAAHAGVVHPIWVNLFLVFVTSILLGKTFNSKGFEHCILIHLGLNLAMVSLNYLGLF